MQQLTDDLTKAVQEKSSFEGKVANLEQQLSVVNDEKAKMESVHAKTVSGLQQQLADAQEKVILTYVFTLDRYKIFPPKNNLTFSY